MLQIEITNEHPDYQHNPAQLSAAVEQVLRDAGVTDATISIAVVDDPTIHELNNRYLQHDYPTDVISFLLEDDDSGIGGEVIVSADTAATTAARLGWSTEHELLLYVVHGMLHLVGYDDLTSDDLAEMRQQERAVMLALGIEPRYDRDPRDDRESEPRS